MKLKNVKNYLRRNIRPKKSILSIDQLNKENEDPQPDLHTRKDFRKSKVIEFLKFKRLTNDVARAKIVKISKEQLNSNLEEEYQFYKELNEKEIEYKNLNFKLKEIFPEDRFSNRYEIKKRTNDFNLSLFFFHNDYEFKTIAYENEHQDKLHKQIYKNKKDETKNDDEDDEKPEQLIPIILIITKVSSDNTGLLVTGLKKTKFIEYTSIAFTEDISTVYKKVKAGEDILSDSNYFSYTTGYSRVKHFLDSDFRKLINDFSVDALMLDVIEYYSTLKNRTLYRNWLENIKNLLI